MYHLTRHDFRFPAVEIYFSVEKNKSARLEIRRGKSTKGKKAAPTFACKGPAAARTPLKKSKGGSSAIIEIGENNAVSGFICLYHLPRKK
jgi:hypothetical protein